MIPSKMEDISITFSPKRSSATVGLRTYMEVINSYIFPQAMVGNILSLYSHNNLACVFRPMEH